jgi:HemY protein
MRRLFLLLLVVLLAAVALAYFVQLDAGYVLVDFHGVSVESSVWIALLCVLAAGILLYVALRVLSAMVDAGARLLGLSLPRGPIASLGESLRDRRRRRGVGAFIAFFEGRWRNAMRQLERGAAHADAPIVNYLFAARASEEMGDLARADALLDRAAATPGSDAVVAVARAEMHLRAGENERALEILDALGPEASQQPAAARLLVETLQRLENWERLAVLLPDIARYRLLQETRLQRLEERVYSALLAAQPAGGGAGGLDLLHTVWRSVPSHARRLPAVMAAYSKVLDESGAGAEAAVLLASALRSEAHPLLIRAYGLLDVEDRKKQLGFAESLLRRAPEDAELLLALGRISLRNELWGKARDYLESSLARQWRPDTCAELAGLYERLGENERSRVLLQRALHAEIGAPAPLIAH